MMLRLFQVNYFLQSLCCGNQFVTVIYYQIEISLGFLIIDFLSYLDTKAFLSAFSNYKAMRDVKGAACRKLIFDAQEVSPDFAFKRIICLLQM